MTRRGRRRPTRSQLGDDVFGVLLQYPATDGAVYDYRRSLRARARRRRAGHRRDRPAGAHAADAAGRVGRRRRGRQLAALRRADGLRRSARGVLRDAATSSSARLPGRIIGVSRDAEGKPALRMALQTREQHIRREKATSNICTAQVLLAVMAGMYAVWHGPEGLTRIAAARARLRGARSRRALERLGYAVAHDDFFDTVRVEVAGARRRTIVVAAAATRGINLRVLARDASIVVALDETVTPSRRRRPAGGVRRRRGADFAVDALATRTSTRGTTSASRARRRSSRTRSSTRYHSETEMLRYLRRLESRDLSLAHSMIPLGSCTMKLNATAEMFPVTWPEFGAHASVRAGGADEGLRASCSGRSRRRSPRSPDSPRCRCSRTPARRASTPACS